MKVQILFFVCCAFFSGAANSESLRSITVQTSDCFTCGMTLGDLGIQICGTDNCCSIQALDNDDLNFVPGGTDVFIGADLGDCYDYYLGSASEPLKVTLYHVGSDAVTLDLVMIETTTRYANCWIESELDDDDIFKTECDAEKH